MPFFLKVKKQFPIYQFRRTSIFSSARNNLTPIQDFVNSQYKHCLFPLTNTDFTLS